MVAVFDVVAVVVVDDFAAAAAAVLGRDGNAVVDL